MNIKQDSKRFNDNLSIQINGLLSPQICKELIDRYEKIPGNEEIKTFSNTIIKECSGLILRDDIEVILRNYFQSAYRPIWTSFDVIDSSASTYNNSTTWHLDGGITKTLKLFVYLNSVTEHGGNTLIIDQHRTEKLRKAGELPLEEEKRKEDFTQVLEQMGLNSSYLAYDLKAGDALLFSPLILAHRCLPPKAEKKRYTICFTLAPFS
ncbi:MAG: hypothetical protein ACU83U_05435 [Gammaproteobacteria bacterium]